MAAPIDLSGKWKVGKSENLDAFLTALGVNVAMRKIATNASITQEITQDGNDMTVVMKLPLKCNGFGFAKRKIASAAPLTVVITQDGDNVTVSNQSPIKTKTTKFTVGSGEFEDETPDGRKIMANAYWEGSSLVVDAKPKDAKEKGLKVVRTIEGDEMHQAMTCDGVTAIRHFSRC
ncbi:unnamed protein product [Owenia fusiformis]|uniref:Uncharacterized protein n=1 Tax=Owenia fusiformis TaxID=6347 RepID=A0A8S4NMS2_OWEFU|nr:unnamed protein product [Owenia fusiformis]